MDEQGWLADRFEEHRPHLHAVAYRLLGSRSEAEDAVQEAWLRASRGDAGDVENLGGWLTTIVARVSLNMLRSRRTRREEPLGPHVPDPVIDAVDHADPERQALVGDSVGLALMVVLETLTPAERLAFVLHDTFGIRFDEIAPILDRTPAATRQLASRARRRVRSGAPMPDRDLTVQWEVVDAFLTAAREGDFDRLVSVLDPDVVLRADAGAMGWSREVEGAEAVAGQAVTWTLPDLVTTRVLVNGVPGYLATRGGELFSAGAFTVRDGRVVALDILADPERLARLELPAAVDVAPE
jgi:RNA polymerase sigma factor (sigma-70 family)